MEKGGSMKTTKGKVKYEPLKGWAGSVCTQDEVIAEMCGPHPNAKADAALIVAAWNAAQEINAENPIAAAEAMPEIFRLLSEAVSDAFKVSHKRLDPHKWLNEANAAILKALERER
jgi:hypothetical protein